jgi:DNA-binding MarR family transcriptional regulator
MATATKQENVSIDSATSPDDACASDLSVAELDAWRGLMRAHAALVKTLDAELEQTHALPLSSFEVLLYLDHSADKRMRMCDLAESALLSRSGLTRLIDRLEREKLVERVSCESDARGAFAELTEAGSKKLADARATHLAGVREHYLERFDATELELLGSFFERIAPGAATAPCGADPDSEVVTAA